MLEMEYSRYWETVVDTMMDGLMVVDPEGMIVSINSAMEQLTGYSKMELIGQPCAVLDCDTCFHSRARGEDKHCELFKEGQVRRCKCILKKKDGKPLHVLKNAAVLRDSSGKIIGGVETLTDLTALVAKEKVITRLRRELTGKDGFQGILGKSPAMQQVFALISSAAQSEAPVVIYGESGTGKELVAGAIHRLGPRRKGPFIKVNCAALNESLLESELFGHVKGSFTGADRTRVGRFEAANGGDIFLDEIGDLPLATQVKLLRVLQEKEIEKVGDHRPIPVDVRVLAATNKNLQTLMETGQFRDDLYYRIGVIPIHLPPLRQRPEDIPLLIETFTSRIRLKTGKAIEGINHEALDLLIHYEWPGNVRELINVLEYAFVICPEGEILPAHLPTHITGQPHQASSPHRLRARHHAPAERAKLLEALKRTGGNKSEAARLLGISRVTLWKRLKMYNIHVDREIRA
ncbi:MAG: sigma 54-interacting transcriptional regulator [Deltaproteobacteria bacterium]|nr:sigma 54-interacting transcriptional regulator [Deltaproteobacteria bacterium]MBW2071089.1 sigma 54-interacting transcriptional regulator [Deltaproteobacteria bacterium]